MQTDCGVGFVDPQPDDDALAELYSTHYYPEHGGDVVYDNSTVSKMEQHVRAFDRELGLTSKSVLDFGCGHGVFLDAARPHTASVAGVEFDDVGRSAAQARGFDVRKSIEEFAPHSFDLIYMNDVIEHLRDPVDELGVLRSRLRPDGSLFVVTMNMKSVTARTQGAKWGIVTNPTHLWFYDERSLSATLRRAGFESGAVQRWLVTFDHHGRVRATAQRLLQRAGLDGSLRVLTRPIGGDVA